MNQKTKEKIKQYLEVTVYLSLSITIITGIFIFTFMLPILTLKDVIIYFTILGILIIASAYFMHKDKSEV